MYEGLTKYVKESFWDLYDKSLFYFLIFSEKNKKLQHTFWSFGYDNCDFEIKTLLGNFLPGWIALIM